MATDDSVLGEQPVFDPENPYGALPQDQPGTDRATERGVVMPLPDRQRGVVFGDGRDKPRATRPPTGRVVTVETVSYHRARDDGPPIVSQAKFVDHTYGGNGAFTYTLGDIPTEGVELASLPGGAVGTLVIVNTGPVVLLVGAAGGEPLAEVLPGRSARWRPRPGVGASVLLTEQPPPEPASEDSPPRPAPLGHATVTLFPE